MATNRAAAPARPGAGGKPASTLHALAGKRPWLVIGGAAAAVVVVVALVKKSSSAAASSSPSTSSTGTEQLPTYDSSLYDIESEFQSQFEGLQNQIAQLTQNQAGASSSAGTSGTQYWSGPVISTAAGGRTVGASLPGPGLTSPSSLQAFVSQVQPGAALSALAAPSGETWQQVFASNIGAAPGSAQPVMVPG